MSAARIAGRHLWRFGVVYANGTVGLNITCSTKSAGAARRAAYRVLRTKKFQRQYPEPSTLFSIVSYQGTLNT